MRALQLLIAVSALSTTIACAPRVSKRAPSPHPDYAWMARTPDPKPVTVKPVQAQAVAVKQQPAPEAVRPVEAKKEEPQQVAYVAKKQPAPAPVVEEEAPEGDDAVVTSVSSKQTSKTNFYAFSDSEISSLRRKNSEFRKSHDKLKQCSSKTEKEIARREQVREEIIQLQNEEFRTPKQEKKLIQLRLEERKMKQQRGESGECQQLENKLTEMLRAAYNGGETTGARH